MIVTSSLVASIALPLAAGTLGFHPAYLVPVIGSGSLMASWMNDSGFWVFAKMGVLTEGETLRSWTVLLSILSLSGFLVTLLFVTLLPFPVFRFSDAFNKRFVCPTTRSQRFVGLSVRCLRGDRQRRLATGQCAAVHYDTRCATQAQQ